MLYLQKYLGIFKNVFLAERWGRLLLRLKVSSAQSFCFCNSHMTTFPTSRKWKISIFPYTVLAEMLYLQKYLTNFQNFFWLKDEEGGYCGWKCQVHSHFAFAIATFQLFQYPEYVKISIFPFTLSQQKCYNFKII